jgi:GNAT superfamily N-acetyltransferase
VDRVTWHAGAGAPGRPPDLPGAPPFDGAVLAGHRPDAHALLVRAAAPGDRCAGQLSLWWTAAPQLPGERLGLIGHFGAADEAAARALIEAALGRLRAERCTLAVGPMDGNTWRRYRLVSIRGTAPPFFLEPWNPPEWPAWWERAGFSALARYASAELDLAREDAGRAEAAAAALRGEGVVLRPLDPARVEAELERIHAVSAAAFREAFLYTPLPRADFLAQYRALLPAIRPPLVQLAEREGELVGFLFAVPDRLEAERGEPAATVVAKTVAVLPAWAGRGLGTALVGRAHAAARAAGYRRVVHALLHASNRSRRLGADRGRPLRGYTLYARRTGA